MPGTKKLCIPCISSNNYKWNGPEVLSLCSQGVLYIKAQRLPLLWPQEEVHDDWTIIPDDVPNGSPANDHHGLPANDHQRSPTRYGRTLKRFFWRGRRVRKQMTGTCMMMMRMMKIMTFKGRLRLVAGSYNDCYRQMPAVAVRYSKQAAFKFSSVVITD
ncbi:PREDICTED: uncharacterized protein LOC107346232 [Acropora digitifera]|uniref:uncharacterized protein LOC107346232 n=1 Tax=Acropora digitifera TaxID=70779 RepID=UPI00077AD6C0|nr:PREDICTED: uncharacterized protein LOC107346232 [Acropora digitifera]